MAGILFKFVLFLVVLSLIGLVVYSFVGPSVFPEHFESPMTEHSEPITLKEE